MSDFKLVTLAEPARRCLWCVSEHYRVPDRPPRPHSSGDSWFGESDHHLPQRWRVVGAVAAEQIPIGSALRVVEDRHQVFYDYGMDSVEWLFEVVDGPQAGEIYFITSFGGHEPDRPINATFDVPWDAQAHPLWPKGLEPIP